MALLLNLFGDVGADFDARSVALQLSESKGPVHVRISSGGGSAFDGLAIYNLLVSSGREVTVDIDGIAASAASVIAMAGKPVRMSEAALLMVHNASSHVGGNSEQLREAADILDKLDGALAAVYARKSGRPVEMIKPMMSAETWMSAQDALAAGLVDEITAGVKVAAQVRAAPSWARLPDVVKNSLRATVASMTPEQLQAALEAALGPVLARLEKLELPPTVEPVLETDVSAESVAIEVAPSVDESVAQMQGIFAEAVSALADEFIASGKLRPEGRELFVNASRTPSELKTACAYFRAALPAVITDRTTLRTVTNTVTPLSATAREYATRARLDIAKLEKVNQ